MGQRDRSRIGRQSKRRLDSNADVLCFSRGALDVYFVRDFVSKDERRCLKDMIKADMSQSGTLGGSYPTFSSFRTSSTSYLSQGDQIIHALDDRISGLVGMDARWGESLQGQHYAVGQTFKPHCDFFYETLPHWNTIRREGGQRTWTAMAYLDDEVEGGDTRFVSVAFKIRPLAGMLVLWNNMTPEGLPNYATLHEGAPIIAGEKTILTKWYRERMWQPIPPKEIRQAA